MKTIEDYIIPEPNSGCHLWTGALNNIGYGATWYLGKVRYAHRVSYEIEYGKIPKGLTLDHLCRVRSCINPRHMEAVTQKENVLRGNSIPALNARKKFCPKCSGPYRKNSRQQRMCVNCMNDGQRNRRAINKLVGAK